MKYVITEHQNKKLKKYKAIKEIVDSFTFDGVEKVEFDVDWDDKFGFYKIYPTFHVSPETVLSNSSLFKTVVGNELVQKIEDYLGIHIVCVNTKIVFK